VFVQAPEPSELTEVGPAQQQNDFVGSTQKKARTAQKHANWVKKVRKGVFKILEGDRRFLISDVAKEDIIQCLDLMGCSQPLPFDWDCTLYTNPPVLRRPRGPTDEIGILEGDLREEENSEEEQDAVERPKWTVNEVHLIGLEAPPYWALAKYLTCYSFLENTLSFIRVTSLPYKRDGFWMGLVRKMFPLASPQWEGAWKEDGPAQEQYSKVILRLFHAFNFFFFIVFQACAARISKYQFC
jgi:hypothetical protein